MARSLALALAALAALPAGSSPVLPAPARGYWLQAAPSEDWESTLHRVASDGTLDPARALSALEEVASHNPRSTASGLAHLAVGLRLVDLGRHAEAQPHLTHPDVSRTALEDFALRALGQVYEKAGEYSKAADAYHRIVARYPKTAVLCGALVRGAQVDDVVGRQDEALGLLQRALAGCPEQEAEALLHLGAVHEHRGDLPAAGAALERVDRDYPHTAFGREAAQRLKNLPAKGRPGLTPRELIGHDLKKALVLFEAGEHAASARLFRALLGRKPDADATDLVRVRLGRALLANGRDREAATVLGQVTTGSAVESEATYHLARLKRGASDRLSALEAVAGRFPGTSWGEEALLDVAHHHQRDGRDDEALPYWRRMLEGYPGGRYTDAATWRVAFGEYRHKRYAEAAEAFEKAARERPRSWLPAYLYWAGRARRALGQEDQARAHFEDVLLRYKNAYHGLRARDALGQVAAGASTTHPAPPEGLPEVPEPWRTRLRQLLLIERLREAMEELSAAPLGPQVQATRSWVFWRLGQLRPAITAMKRAYPEYVTESGDGLPEAVWRILFPLPFAEQLTASARAAGVDGALVAALVLQESTFDTQARSGAGARGLMQVVPRTGRSLARGLGIRRFDAKQLFHAETNLRLGTVYLKDMIRRFGGRVERALAAYNAGPHRAAIWHYARPDMSAEEFVDSIPYQETRTYVMTILASQEQYRRLYALPGAPAGYAGARP